MTKPESKAACDLTMDALILLILQGQTDLYEEIVQRYQGDVLRVVNAMLFDRAATEDIAQQVFVNAYTHLTDFETGRDFGGWIRTIARNAVREHLRRTSRYDRRLQVYAEVMERRLQDEQLAVQHDEALDEALRKCLERLPNRSAEAIRLRYTEGRAFAEVAEMLECSPEAARNLLCRVRTKLRECVERESK